jgi:hypothetical protein
MPAVWALDSGRLAVYTSAKYSPTGKVSAIMGASSDAERGFWVCED